MEIDKLFGIPAHPLLVHVPVVFTPLAAIGAVAIVAVPRWRRPYGLLVAAFAALAAIGVQLATWSGEGLEDRVDRNAAVDKHIDLAETARPLVFVFFVVVVAYVAFDRWVRAGDRRRSWTRPAMVALSVLTVASAATATVWLVRAGHQGADAVWRGTGETSGG